MSATLETYIPLEEAIQRYYLDERLLTRLIKDGTIRAVNVNSKIAVAAEDVEMASSFPGIPSPSKDMKGRGIRARDAILKYKIASHSTLAGWRSRGIVKVLQRNHKNVVYDEYSVAVAAQTYHANKHRPQGIRYTIHQ